MVASLAHRGPDASGIHHDGVVFLGHARLSIIDLDSGSQPMCDQEERYWVVFNGEIYNYRELRDELESHGHKFRTSSDTEVLIHGFRQWGTDLFGRLDGIFAFALWDSVERELVVARDCFGIKPLHYVLNGQSVGFASEVKALLCLPNFDRSADLQAVHDFLNLRYIPGERTLFSGVRRLLPGRYLVFRDGRLSEHTYYSLTVGECEARTEEEYADGIRHYLCEAVRKQLVADVPIGVYLSGGLDSSSLVACMAEVGHSPIRTFSMGFDEPTDELDDARVVAQHFGTEHHEITLSADPLKEFPRVIYHTEEPKENVLQGFLLARFAREGVKAVLGGLGGDELFAGYSLHRYVYPFDRIQRWVPRLLGHGLLRWASDSVSAIQHRMGPLVLDDYSRGAQLLLSAGDPLRQYLVLRNAWDFERNGFRRHYGSALLEAELSPTSRSFEPYFCNGHGTLTSVLDAEFHTKMVDDFLCNEDRTSMAHGLEVRVPFLDRDLVEFAWSIPSRLKMRGNTTKHLFRRAMSGMLPEHTLKKPKWGFSFNPHLQFQKDLRTVAQRVLTRQRVEERGWFNFEFIQRILDHRPHRRLRWHYFFIWLAVGLEIWAQMFLDGDFRKPTFELEAYTA